MEHIEHAEHAHGPPIGLYLKVWALLFVLSTLSYMVDLFHVHGQLRWTLILALMMAKAGLIVAIFMHLRWERRALIAVILVPPLALMVLVAMMFVEADYTFLTRMTFFR